MAQHVQEPQAIVSQTGKRRRIPANTWRLLLCIAALIIIVIFVLASIGDFPTIMGMTPLVFATILSGCIGILSLLVGIIPLIRDDVQQNNDASSQPVQPVSTGPSTTLFSGDSASENTVSANAFMTGSTLSPTR